MDPLSARTWEFRTGDTTACFGSFSEALRLNEPVTSKSAIAQMIGALLFEESKYGEALEYFDLAVASTKSPDFDLQVEHAQCNLYAGNYQASFQLYKSLTAEHVDSLAGYDGMLSSLAERWIVEQESTLDQAITVIDQGVRALSDSVEIASLYLREMGFYVRADRNLEAQTAALQAARFSPQDPEPPFYVSKLSFEDGRLLSALDYAAQSVALFKAGRQDGYFITDYFDWGETYLDDPRIEMTELMFHMAELYKELGDDEAACNYFALGSELKGDGGIAAPCPYSRN